MCNSKEYKALVDELNKYDKDKQVDERKLIWNQINADVNGASNIIRKAIPDVFNNIDDYSYLYKTVKKVNIGV